MIAVAVVGLLLVIVASVSMFLRGARHRAGVARTFRRVSMTYGCRAFNAYRMAGDSPGPTWSELTPVVRCGWADFTQGRDAADAYARFVSTVRVGPLGRPLLPWAALDRADQARWAVAFAALLDEDDGPRYDGGRLPLVACAIVAVLASGCGTWTWARVDHVASELDAACRDPARPLTGGAVAAGLAIADASAREPSPEAAAASVADKVKTGAHTASALACVVARIAAIFGTLPSGEHPKGDTPRPRVAVVAQLLAAQLARPPTP
jgi:hypothetical protein